MLVNIPRVLVGGGGTERTREAGWGLNKFENTVMCVASLKAAAAGQGLGGRVVSEE
jgi:hypothetical protein